MESSSADKRSLFRFSPIFVLSQYVFVFFYRQTFDFRIWIQCKNVVSEPKPDRGISRFLGENYKKRNGINAHALPSNDQHQPHEKRNFLIGQTSQNWFKLITTTDQVLRKLLLKKKKLKCHGDGVLKS